MTEPPPLPLDGTPRYAPGRSLPPYRFVPGRHPHPTAHTDGHSYGRAPEPGPAPEGSTWRSHGLYLYACDLYNHGFFWEAHEAWEELWHRAPTTSPDRLVLQGLIQVAAAHLKERTGAPDGARRLATRGTSKLHRARLAGPSTRLGVALDAFTDAVESWFRGDAGGWPKLELGAAADD